MRRFSKPSADRVASIRVDLLPQCASDANTNTTSACTTAVHPEAFKALVSSQAVVSALEDTMGLLFGASACAITLSGANISARELAVHIHSAGGGGSSSPIGPSGLDQLRAACALVTSLPLSERTSRLLHKSRQLMNNNSYNGNGNNADSDDREDDQPMSSERNGSEHVNALLGYCSQVGGDAERCAWVLPVRLTVARAQ